MNNLGSNPHVYGVSPGKDFPKLLLAGLESRMGLCSPADWSKVEIFVNTRRMQRRLRDLFNAEQARLLPKIRVMTDLASDQKFTVIPPATSGLRRRLDLSQLVSSLLDSQPNLAPRSALFDLSDSLSALLEEMDMEGVEPSAIKNIDVSDQSGHWRRSLQFVELVQNFVNREDGLSAEARFRQVVQAKIADWGRSAPDHPVIVAGSTGSRGAASLLMQAVAKLPQGAVVLPGVDYDMPQEVWEKLTDAMASEDHPQYRFATFARAVGMHPADISQWVPEKEKSARGRLISLALRPAPVTDQWMTEGKSLGHLPDAIDGMSLIEAPSPRLEAMAVAIALRQAVEDGKVAALITPDRNLTRQVTAALDHWKIVPDDSGGQPLSLSPPGRFLRHVSALFQQKLTIEALLTLLKHPLTNSSDGDRGKHLLHSRDLELYLRRRGRAYPTADDLFVWAKDGEDDRKDWGQWVADSVCGLGESAPKTLSTHVSEHIALAELLAGGQSGGSGALWEKAAGEEALRQVSELREESTAGGVLSSVEYSALFNAVLNRAEVREAPVAHPRVMIWGTLEARVEGADLVILGGLNEGVWPKTPQPDPWLNRKMRHDIGLLLPERQIGLSAHDFQQAIGAKEVILSRAFRDNEAETVPSRWLNRLGNLLRGLSDESAKELKKMRERGARYLRLAAKLEEVSGTLSPAPRPSPRPPAEARPKEISVTEVQKLIRDPYAVYARRVLGLEPLSPMRISPDAPMRGTLIHKVLEKFAKEGRFGSVEEGKNRLLSIADETFEHYAPWPATRAVWRKQLESIADWFLQGETDRLSKGSPVSSEGRGSLRLDDIDVSLVGRPDRVDRLSDGSYAVYDYKTGKPSTKKQQETFDKQLPLTAALVERGALEGLHSGNVTEVGYISLTKNPIFDTIPLEQGEIDTVLGDLVALLRAYQDQSKGYPSRRAVEKREHIGDYDHLARFGEWDEATDPTPEDMGK